MKAWLSIIILFFVVSFASAQVSISASYNYALYKGAFKRNVPGVQLRALYLWEGKQGLYFSYTHGIPISEGSMFIAAGNNANVTVDSKIQYQFKTYNLGFYAHIAGNDATKGSLYFLPNLQYVIADYNETATQPYDQERYPFTSEKSEGREGGVFGNVTVGAGYKLGPFAFFGEVGYAYPAATSNDPEFNTDIPPQIIFNTGVKIKLGRRAL
jgi:hypothetical protein